MKPASPTPSNTGSARSFHMDTERGINLLRCCEVLQRGEAEVYGCATRAPRVPAPAHTAQVAHHKEGVSGYTLSDTAHTVLPQIDDEKFQTQAHSQLENGHYWLHFLKIRLDTMSLRICSGNRAKKPLKGHLGHKSHTKYIKVIDFYITVPPIVNKDDWGCIVRDLETGDTTSGGGVSGRALVCIA